MKEVVRDYGKTGQLGEAVAGVLVVDPCLALAIVTNGRAKGLLSVIVQERADAELAGP